MVASMRYAVVQYDTPLLPPFATIAAEVALFPTLAAWVADQTDDPASPLHGLLDPARIVVAGHSRGGKLASLMLTSECCWRWSCWCCCCYVMAGRSCCVLQ